MGSLITMFVFEVFLVSALCFIDVWDLITDDDVESFTLIG